jgi:hypothetical protein
MKFSTSRRCSMWASRAIPRTAIRLVRDGRVALSRIYPQPMTQAEAAAWLADLNV